MKVRQYGIGHALHLPLVLHLLEQHSDLRLHALFRLLHFLQIRFDSLVPSHVSGAAFDPGPALLQQSALE